MKLLKASQLKLLDEAIRQLVNEALLILIIISDELLNQSIISIPYPVARPQIRNKQAIARKYSYGYHFVCQPNHD